MDIKDSERALFKPSLLVLESNCPSNISNITPKSNKGTIQAVEQIPWVQVCRSRVPPGEPFTSERLDRLWEEWLPPLERAEVWYDWGEPEKLIQLVGHLQGKAHRE